MAATVTSEEIFEGFLGEFVENKTFFHGHTYTGNPLACAVAIASLDLFEKERIIENLQPKIAFLTGKLKAFRELKYVGDIRQRGMMVGIELVADKESRESLPAENRTGHQVIMQARKQGVLIRPLGDVIVLMPHLAMSIAELDLLCRVTYDSIRLVTERN